QKQAATHANAMANIRSLIRLEFNEFSQQHHEFFVADVDHAFGLDQRGLKLNFCANHDGDCISGCAQNSRSDVEFSAVNRGRTANAPAGFRMAGQHSHALATHVRDGVSYFKYAAPCGCSVARSVTSSTGG